MKTQVFKGDTKIINAWAFYDWANSAYPLVINTAIFPIYYSKVTSNDYGDMLTLLGFNFNASALYSYTLSFSFLLVSLLSPLLSGIADYSGNKKSFLTFFCYFGAACCAGLYFFDTNHLLIGLLMVVGASVGFWGSIVFYNAYLPEIAAPEDHDSISAKGYALGYLGSSILLIANLVIITNPSILFDIEAFAVSLMEANSNLSMEEAIDNANGHYTGVATRWSFISVAVWWVVFAQITLRFLPNNVFNRNPTGNRFYKGYLEIKKVWFELNQNRVLKTYLLSFFIFSMGVQTVMLMATIFAEKEINLGTSELIATMLIIQFVAIGGSYLFAFLSKIFGNIQAISIALIIWIGVCVGAYFVHQASGFYIIAAIVGLIMGGIQSLSRSTYSKMLPQTIDHASYFSFYDVCEKIGIVIGTLSYGAIIELTGSMRYSIFALGFYFILGWIILMFIPKNILRPSLLKD